MKNVTLSPREYLTNFIFIAKFSFLTRIFHGQVIVTADTKQLEYLGF